MRRYHRSQKLRRETNAVQGGKHLRRVRHVIRGGEVRITYFNIINRINPENVS
jgi:hypothetical protein